VRLDSASFAASKGTVLHLTLSAKATVQVAVTQRVAGRMFKGHQCRLGARKGRRCTATIMTRTVLFNAAAGRNGLGLRLPGLPRGHYTATVTARGASGAASTAIPFTITR
jgi:hypothetical protein